MKPVRTRSRDDPRAGQSNIVVSRTPVQTSEAAHVFLNLFFLLSVVCFLRLRELHLLEVRLTDFIAFSCTAILVLKKAGANCRESKMVSIKMHYLQSLCKHKLHYVNMPM